MGKLPVVVVAGLGRCGTSLVLQMLDKAGVATVGTFPDYESRGTHASPGQAVKWLDAFRTNPPFNRSRRAIVIWLDRDPEQQALSMVKMLGLGLAVDVPESAVVQIATSIGPDTKRCLAVLGQWPKLLLRFEDLIDRPQMAAERITDYLSRYGFPELDPSEMAGCLIPRESACTPDLSIELALIAESAPADVGGMIEHITGARV
jgi:hypothetical protein